MTTNPALPSDAPAPWQQQPKESSKAWAAFRLYCELDPTSRSLAKLTELMRQKHGKQAVNLRQLETWSARWRWQARLAAWEAEKDRAAKEAELDSTRSTVVEAKRRLLVALGSVAAELIRLATHAEDDGDRIRAITAIMDRAGIPAVKRDELSGLEGRDLLQGLVAAMREAREDA